MKRWVGLGVIADNLHHLGTALENARTEFLKCPEISSLNARQSARRAFRRF
jgi:hypothetical protein